MFRFVLLPLVAFFFCQPANSALAQSGSVEAENGPSDLDEGTPPDQTLSSDRPVPITNLAITLDVGCLIFGEATLVTRVAAHPHVSLGLRAGWSSRLQPDAILLLAGIELWPLGLGIEQLHLGISAGVMLNGPDRSALDGRVELDAGWVFRWSDLVLELGLGLAATFNANSDPTWLPLVRAGIGWSWT